MKRLSAFSMCVSVLGCILVLGGLVYLLAPEIRAIALRHHGEKVNLTQFLDAPSEAQTVTSVPLSAPKELHVPRLNIALELQKASYSPEMQWSLDDTHAFYTLETATPLFYGHATEAVFLKLNGIAKNELLYITNDQQQTLRFRYVQDQIVSPTDVSVLKKKIPRSILLLTCTGPHFEQRRVLEFTFVGVEKNQKL